MPYFRSFSPLCQSGRTLTCFDPRQALYGQACHQRTRIRRTPPPNHPHIDQSNHPLRFASPGTPGHDRPAPRASRPAPRASTLICQRTTSGSLPRRCGIAPESRSGRDRRPSERSLRKDPDQRPHPHLATFAHARPKVNIKYVYQKSAPTAPSDPLKNSPAKPCGLRRCLGWAPCLRSINLPPPPPAG